MDMLLKLIGPLRYYCQIVHIELFIDKRVDRLTDLIDLCRVLMVVVID